MRIFLFILICGLVACMPALYKPAAEQAEKSGSTLGDLRRGRQLYIDHCGSCHALYLPREYPPASWDQLTLKMQKRAKIDSSQRQLILRYLTSE